MTIMLSLSFPAGWFWDGQGRLWFLDVYDTWLSPVTGVLMHKLILAAALAVLPAHAAQSPTIYPNQQCRMPSALEQKMEKKGLRCPATIVKVKGSTAFCVAGTPPCDDPKGMQFIERLKGECMEKTGQPCPIAVEIDPAGERYRTLCGPPLPEVQEEPSQEK